MSLTGFLVAEWGREREAFCCIVAETENSHQGKALTFSFHSGHGKDNNCCEASLTWKEQVKTTCPGFLVPTNLHCCQIKWEFCRYLRAHGGGRGEVGSYK